MAKNKSGTPHHSCGHCLCWFVPGIWFGWGYCPITDWEWQVKERLGETNLPNSFIKYYADKITGKNIDPSVVDTTTLVLFLAAIILSLYVNFFRRKITNKFQK